MTEQFPMHVIRRLLREEASTKKTVDFFVEQHIAEDADSDGDSADEACRRVCSHQLRTLYPQYVDLVYRYAESPIEIMFLNSMLLTFLRCDPLGLVMTAPFRDAPKALAQRIRVVKSILDLDAELRGATGGGIGIEAHLDLLVDEGEITQAVANEAMGLYVRSYILGFYDAFHLTPQAGFPNIKVDGRAIRVDLLVWIPSRPEFSLVVECDGYEYHKGKESFERDRKRDRILIAEGHKVFRFGGPEIWRDPAAASVELFDYLAANSPFGDAT